MKKIVILLSLVLVLTFLASSTNAIRVVDLDDILSGCTIGVNHASVTTQASPMLWKVGDVPDGDLKHIPEDACGIVYYYSTKDLDLHIDYNLIGTTTTWKGLDPQKKISGGLNEAGVGTGNSRVLVATYDNQNLAFMFHVLGHYGEIPDIRNYIESPLGKTEFTPSGCFPFIDRAGNATMFELDPSEDNIWEYDTTDEDRIEQKLQGFVVRANEFHKHDDGTDNIDIPGRYRTGTENTKGLIAVDELNEQSAVQSDSNEAFRLVRQNDKPWPISNEMSRGAIVIRGVAQGEDPALATMWVLLGNPSFSIAVPTWVAVSSIPESIGTCAMYDAVKSLFNEATTKEKQVRAEWVQTAVLPAEGHLFKMVNERLLPHWRTLGGAPAVEEMTRIEHQMAQDAFSVVNYLATKGEHNLAPTIDFEARQRPNLKYTFSADAADVDGSVVSYLWDFGDGITSQDVTPMHEFADSGVYLVSVTVADDDGVTTTAWRYLTDPAP